jgi:CHAD domain-containing protein
MRDRESGRFESCKALLFCPETCIFCLPPVNNMAFDQDRVAQLFNRLDRQLTKLSSKPQPKNIHQFRTAARRVETLISELIADPNRKERKLLKLMTKLRRRAGKVRDLDVQIGALRSLRIPEQPALKTQLLQAMTEKRARREQRFLHMLDNETIRELRRRLKYTRDHFCESARDPESVAATMLRNFATQDGEITEKVLHRCRIQGKKIRYLAEIAANNDLQHVIEELKHMQDVLGDWHDWLTLSASVAKLMPDRVNSPLVAAVNNIMHAKYRDALEAVKKAKLTLMNKPATAVGARKPDVARPAALAKAVA